MYISKKEKYGKIFIRLNGWIFLFTQNFQFSRFVLFFFATEIKKWQQEEQQQRKNINLHLMEHQSSVKAKKKISFEAFKTFSHRLALRNGSVSVMDSVVVKLWRIWVLGVKNNRNKDPDTFHQAGNKLISLVWSLELHQTATTKQNYQSTHQ